MFWQKWILLDLTKNLTCFWTEPLEGNMEIFGLPSVKLKLYLFFSLASLINTEFSYKMLRSLPSWRSWNSKCRRWSAPAGRRSGAWRLVVWCHSRLGGREGVGFFLLIYNNYFFKLMKQCNVCKKKGVSINREKFDNFRVSVLRIRIGSGIN